MDVQLIVSALATLLFLVTSGFRILRGGGRISFWTSLLAIVALATALLSVSRAAPTMQQSRLVALGLSAILIVAGIVFILIEMRQPNRNYNKSRGLLSLGTGVLILIGLFIGPLASQMIAPNLLNAVPGAASSDAPVALAATNDAGTAESIPADVASAETAARSDGTATPAHPMPTVTASFEPDVSVLAGTPLPPRPSLPTPTPTNTPFAIPTYVPVTAIPAAQTLQCQGIVQKNLNLREGPSTNQSRLTTIPSGDEVDVTGRTDDATWLQVHYGTLTGWVSADFVLPDGDCDIAPVQSP